MRIIAGRFRGTHLFTPARADIRPTADRLRAAIFNILQQRIRGKRVLDLFAGTGALGIEALSRGASHAAFVDQEQHAVDLVRRNIAKVRVVEKATVLQWDIARNLHCLDGCGQFDFVFMDPPYRQGLIRRTLENLAAAECEFGMVIAEHETGETMEHLPGGFHLRDQRRYGKTLVSFLTPVV